VAAMETDTKPKEAQEARLLNLMGTKTLKVYYTLITTNNTDTNMYPGY